MEKYEMIGIWESKIKEIEDTGNCLNKCGERFFSTGGRNPYTKEEMINYCKTKIEQIKNETVS